MSIKNVIEKEYENVYSIKDFLVNHFSELKNKYDIEISNMTYGVSSCSDELNRDIDSVEILGNKFILGGIGGFPHTGLTGMTAYSHHISEDGTAFIMYAPHIGITDTGELGKVLRPNQSKFSTSCGALALALSRFKDVENYTPDTSNLDDIQQMTLESKLLPFKEQILSFSNPMKEITEVTYKLIEEQVYKLVESCKKEFSIKNIVLVGGVMINTSPYFEDYIDIRKTEVISL